jgi:X-X-X-Leu-X-X-Gly heptad repeat protein
LEGGLEQLQEGAASLVDGRGELLEIVVDTADLDVEILVPDKLM